MTWLALACGLLPASAGRADVFDMPDGQTSLALVTVGDPGNAADTAVMNDGTSGYGSVPYVYRIGQYDVTIGQYCQFLNAVAKIDTFGLYNAAMSYSFLTIGISQNGTSGNYGYSITGSDPQAANCPIFDVTWGDARASATGCKTDSRCIRTTPLARWRARPSRGRTRSTAPSATPP